MFILWGILFVAIGLVLLIAPKTVYKITESWKNDAEGEPSGIFLMSTRFGGAIFCIIGVLAIISVWL